MNYLNVIDARVEVYNWAKSNMAQASNPEISGAISNRRDVIIFTALLEALKNPPVLPTIFLVYRDERGCIKTIRLMSWLGLALIGVAEKDGHFVFKIAGFGITGIGELRVCLSDLGLKPQ